MQPEVPITSHPDLPDGIPLVADFHDDRNRLSYYYPRLRELDEVECPQTLFVGLDHSTDGIPTFDGRFVTEFMQDIHASEAFVRGEYCSAKLDHEAGSHIESQDAYDIESTVNELFAQCAMMEQPIGRRIAVREWVPHDREIRFFIRDGQVVYASEVVDEDGIVTDPEDIDRAEWQAQYVASEFDTFAWSLDFIRHEDTESWYCIDMGLDGLYYHDSDGWTAISGHLDPDQSPEQYSDKMPDPDAFLF